LASACRRACRLKKSCSSPLLVCRQLSVLGEQPLSVDVERRLTGRQAVCSVNSVQLRACVTTYKLVQLNRNTSWNVSNDLHAAFHSVRLKTQNTRMWANAQPDGRPAEYRWRPLLNAAVWLTPTTRVPCSNEAKTRNPLKLAGVPKTNERISAASRPKFTIFWGHLEEILLLNKFFSDCRYVP